MSAAAAEVMAASPPSATGTRPTGMPPSGTRSTGTMQASTPARPWGCLAVAGPGRRQAGSATLIALALVVFVMLAGVMALDVGLLVVARARAQTAADLAALAALTPSDAGPVPGAPGTVAAANGAELVACSCGPTEAVVTVRSHVRMLPAGVALSVTARARSVLPGLDGPESLRGQGGGSRGQAPRQFLRGRP
jgi:secretion/DNA translocation related TadE-like protein